MFLFWKETQETFDLGSNSVGQSTEQNTRSKLTETRNTFSIHTQVKVFKWNIFKTTFWRLNINSHLSFVTNGQAIHQPVGLQLSPVKLPQNCDDKMLPKHTVALYVNQSHILLLLIRNVSYDFVVSENSWFWLAGSKKTVRCLKYHLFSKMLQCSDLCLLQITIENCLR